MIFNGPLLSLVQPTSSFLSSIYCGIPMDRHKLTRHIQLPLCMCQQQIVDSKFHFRIPIGVFLWASHCRGFCFPNMSSRLRLNPIRRHNCDSKMLFTAHPPIERYPPFLIFDRIRQKSTSPWQRLFNEMPCCENGNQHLLTFCLCTGSIPEDCFVARN